MPRSPVTPGPRSSRRGERKARARVWLEARDLVALRAWAAGEPMAISTLVSFLQEREDLLRWRVIEALGWVAADRAAADLDSVRDLVRRQLWSMNDESGNVAWHAAEAIGEVLFRVPPLCPTFLPLLCAFRRTFPFAAGVSWARARLAAAHPALLADEIHELVAELDDGDPAVRGHAARALGALRTPLAREPLGQLLTDDAVLVLYDPETGTIGQVTVGALARKALELL